MSTESTSPVAMVGDLLDLGVSDRQQIGASFTRQPSTGRRARDVMSGVLHLAPHEPWATDDLADWHADPYADRNWRFQRHTLRWLVPVGLMADEGDAEARAEWLRVMRSWAITHPVRGREERSEVWGDMATGLRAIVLTLGARLVGGDDVPWYLELLVLHRDWLADRANLGSGNHALHQHQGLFVVSSLLKDLVGQQTAVDRMQEQFDTAFDHEGANDEGSAAYHQLNMIWWAEAWQRVAAEGFPTPSAVEHKLRAADEVLAHLTLPSGALAQIGDGPVTRAREGLGPSSTWLASGGTAGRPSTSTTSVLARGYVLSRTDWSHDATYVAMRYGRRAPSGHAHEDRGAVLVHSAGVHWLVDSGFSSYQTNDPVVTYLRSPAAHNVPMLDGENVDLDGEVVLSDWGADDGVRHFLLRDERYGPHSLTRRIVHLVEPDCLLVIDSATAAEGTAGVSLSQQWHLNPLVRSRRTDRGFALVADGRRAVMHWLGRQARVTRHDARDGSPEGWVYPKWKTAVPSTVLRATARGPRPVVALLFARSAPQEFGVVEAHVSATGVVSATLMRGPKVWQVVVGERISVDAVERDWS